MNVVALKTTIAKSVQRLRPEDVDRFLPVALKWGQDIQGGVRLEDMIDEFKAFLSQGCILGVFLEGAMVGFLIFHIEVMKLTRSKAAVENMVFIDPDHRGHGLFNMLVEEMESIAKEAGCDSCLMMPTTIGSGNPKAVAKKIQSYGYKEIGYVLRKGL